ncbi:hypothetical protein [Streptomyces shenzhenensis]|uniref:hypothetical protein n=1 Tax=Streptomyces shenzhenensis TaxID=943815 RepID=UPI00369358EF
MGIAELAEELSDWPGTEVEAHPQANAVLPKYSHTLVAAAALQVLDGLRLRLHCVITTERRLPEGNRIVEHWRARQECSANEAPQIMTTMLGDQSSHVRSIRPDFDRARDSTAENADRTPKG